MDSVLATTMDHHFLESMGVESQYEPLCNKENHTQLREDTSIVANRTTDPIQAMPNLNLSLGNEEMSFLAEF